MAAPVYRPSGVLAGTFGVGILTFLLLPSEVGYQDLAALITRDAATLDRPQKHSRASQYGAPHSATHTGTLGPNLNLSQMSGSGIKPPVEFTLAGLDPNSPEITGSIRDRILREGTVLFAPEGANPWVDRSRKGDQLTNTNRKNENVASKGDRLGVPPVQQAEVDPDAATETPAQRVAVAPATETPSSADPVAQQVAVAPAVNMPATDVPSTAPSVTVVESEQMVEAERQLAQQIEQAAQSRQAQARPSDESEPTLQTADAERRKRRSGPRSPAARARQDRRADGRSASRAHVSKKSSGAPRRRPAFRRRGRRRLKSSPGRRKHRRPHAAAKLQGPHESKIPRSRRLRPRRAGKMRRCSRPPRWRLRSRWPSSRPSRLRRRPPKPSRSLPRFGRSQPRRSNPIASWSRAPAITVSDSIRASSNARLRQRFQAMPRATSRRKSPRARRTRSRPRPPSRRASQTRRSARRRSFSASIRWASGSVRSSRGRRARSRNSMTARRTPRSS